MRFALALALSLAFPVAPAASAHCYSVWRYPFAQACGTIRPPVARIARRTAAPALDGATVDRAAVKRVLEPSPGPLAATVGSGEQPPDIPLTDPDPAVMALRASLAARAEDELWTFSPGPLIIGSH
jgi:hypothetical protein